MGMKIKEPADALVVFGVTGDLSYKKIFPSLYSMFLAGKLTVPVIGVASRPLSDEQLVQRARNSIEDSGVTVDDGTFSKFAGLLQYVSGNYREAETFRHLKLALEDARYPLFYLAIPPSLFDDVITQLNQTGCARNDAKVIIEKPFGRDLDSAQQLNHVLHQTFQEENIFRIDHYLGKEAVQNLLYFRFANTMFEPVWNRNYVNSVQILMAEDFGISGRGKFYDETGAIRDVIQNHMLQIVALLAMEPPASGSVDALRSEKVKILKAIKPLDESSIVRGQFRGYLDEPGVANNSKTETFATVKLHVDSWRWADVPFYVRTGKHLPAKVTEVLVEFKQPPQAVFSREMAQLSNHVRFRLGPEVSIGVGAHTKLPGEAMHGHPVELSVCSTLAEEMPAYERLMGDAMRGDATLFARQDGVEAAWRVVDPVLDTGSDVHVYEPGTWGPEAADDLIGKVKNWHACDDETPPSK
jgi:glucose-6-phosphate 1-dehydrogenase